MTPKVLIFGEDEQANDSLLRLYRRAGFEPRVADREQALVVTLRQFQPDLIVVTEHLSLAASAELCRSVRLVSDVPLLAAPLHHNDHAEVALLAAGCDDYIATDRPPRSILARSERQLYRGRQATQRDSTQQVGQLKVNTGTRAVSWANQNVPVTRTEFDILRILALNAHRVVHRRELIGSVWGAWYSDDHVLEVHLSRLRRKFRDVGAPSIVTPVRGVGYRLTADRY